MHILLFTTTLYNTWPCIYTHIHYIYRIHNSKCMFIVNSFSNSRSLLTQLGGKNAGIVFSDADLDKCIPTMIKSSFINQGEVCLTTSRIYVQDDIYQTFLERFVKMTR